MGLDMISTHVPDLQSNPEMFAVLKEYASLHRLSEVHQAGIHKAYHHHRRGRGALDKGCDYKSGEESGEPVAGHSRQNVAQAVAGSFLNCTGIRELFKMANW